MEELSILQKSAFLKDAQASIAEVEKNQLSSTDTLTKSLQILADGNLSEGAKMALIAEIAGYVQLASFFLAPLLIVGGILAASGSLTALLSEAAISGTEGAAQLAQGVLSGTQGMLDASSSDIKATMQRNKTATTNMQQNIDDTLGSTKQQSERAQQQTSIANKVLDNDAQITRQKTIQ
jgi:hypothetical protein